MKEESIKAETEQIRKIEGIRIASLGFISSSGFEKEGELRVSGEDLYKPII